VGLDPWTPIDRRRIAGVMRTIRNTTRIALIDAATVEAWANLVEGREDTQFEPAITTSPILCFRAD
jgi:hypothetical protein